MFQSEFRLRPVIPGAARQYIVQSSLRSLVGLRRLDIPGIKDLAARVSPALRMRDPRLLRAMLLGAVAIALQYGTKRQPPAFA